MKVLLTESDCYGFDPDQVEVLEKDINKFTIEIKSDNKSSTKQIWVTDGWKYNKIAYLDKSIW